MLQNIASFAKVYSAAFVTAFTLSMFWVGVLGDLFGFVATTGEHVVAAVVIVVATFIFGRRFASLVNREEQRQASQMFGWFVIPSLILTTIALTRVGGWLAEAGGPPQLLLAFMVWLPILAIIIVGTQVAWAQEAK